LLHLVSLIYSLACNPPCCCFTSFQTQPAVHKEMNMVIYDETNVECAEPPCLTVNTMINVLSKVELEKVPRMCPPDKLLLKDSDESNGGMWWTPEADVVYNEQMKRYKLAVELFGVEAVTKHEGNCLPANMIVQEVVMQAESDSTVD
jgi:hypothetical protein